MDCHQAQAQLDFTKPGKDAPAGPDGQAAQRHLAECDACRLASESQRQFDLQVSRAMVDVAVPEGLADRLRAAVSTATAQAASGTGEAAKSSSSWPKAVTSTRLSRFRTGRRVALGIVATLVPLLLWALLVPRALVLNEVSVRELGNLKLDALTVDTRSSAFPAPAGWSTARTIQMGDTARKAPVGRRDVPIMPFLLQPDRRSSRVTGFLLRLPKSQWHATPDATSFASAPIQYESFGTWVVWREGNAVYVCVLHENAHVMQRLQDLIAGGRGLT
jgi:hypothetical protein